MMKKGEGEEDDWNPLSASTAPELAEFSQQADCCRICSQKGDCLHLFPSNKRIFAQREWIAGLHLSAESATGLLKRHRLDVANGLQPRWCQKCIGAEDSDFSQVDDAAGSSNGQMQTQWDGCFICNSRVCAVHLFPGNAAPYWQRKWVERLRLPPEETDCLITAHQEAIKQAIHPRWCSKHFASSTDHLPKDANKVYAPLSPSATAELVASSSKLADGCCCICELSGGCLHLFPSNDRIFLQREWIAGLRPSAETAAKLLKRHRLDIAGGAQPRWCETCIGATSAKSDLGQVDVTADGDSAEVRRPWNHGGCFICNSEASAWTLFPDKNPHWQWKWVERLNLPAEEAKSLRAAHREALKIGIHPRWCSEHFDAKTDRLPKSLKCFSSKNALSKTERLTLEREATSSLNAAKDRAADEEVRAMIRDFGYGTKSHPLPPTRCCVCNLKFYNTPALIKHLKYKTCSPLPLETPRRGPPPDASTHGDSPMLQRGNAAVSPPEPATVHLLNTATVQLPDSSTTVPLQLRRNRCCICWMTSPHLFFFPPNEKPTEQGRWMSRLKCTAGNAAILLSRHRFSIGKGLRPKWCEACGGTPPEKLPIPMEETLSDEQQLEEITRRQKEALHLLERRLRQETAEASDLLQDLPRQLHAISPAMEGTSKLHWQHAASRASTDGPISPEETASTHWGEMQQSSARRQSSYNEQTLGREASGNRAIGLQYPMARQDNYFEFWEASEKEREGSQPKRSRLTASDSTLQSSLAVGSFISKTPCENATAKMESVDVKEEGIGEQLLICMKHSEEVEMNWEGEQRVKEEDEEGLNCKIHSHGIRYIPFSVYNPPLFLPLNNAGETEGETTEVKEGREYEEKEEGMP